MGATPMNSRIAPTSFSHRAVDFFVAGDLVTFFTALAALVCCRGGLVCSAVPWRGGAA